MTERPVLLGEVLNWPLPHQAQVLLRELIDRGPRRTRDLVRALWGHDPDGGPLCPENAVRVHIVSIKRALRNGWDLRNLGNAAVGIYALERAETRE